MAELTLSALYRYPVKSMGGDRFETLDVDARGFRFDRQWMVVDAHGHFLTQREQPRLALIKTSVDEDGVLRLRAPGHPDIAVGRQGGDRLAVVVWADTVQARAAGAEVDAWLSDFLSVSCRLVSFPDDVLRPVDPGYATPSDQVGFADGFPFLLISQASLDDLNARMEQPVPMLRFRPNLVVEGCEPYAEDSWRVIRIGELTFRVAKPCARCIIPTIDPATALRGKEPLRTLMRYRRRGNHVFFGQNLIHDRSGRLALGMAVEVLE